jgi:hypothetical protein
VVVVVSVLAGGSAVVVTDLLVFAPVSDFGGGEFTMTGAGTTSVFCSHAPKSAALARTQTNFFMIVMVFYFRLRLWG